MTRSKWVLCLALVGIIGACGGRNGLRAGAGDGGSGNSDARRDGSGDGKQDGLSDVRPVITDARLDVPSTDARLDVRLDVPQTDGRSDVPTDYRAPDVIPNFDVRDGGRDLPPTITDGPRDVPDARRDDASDGGPVVTLSSIETSDASEPSAAPNVTQDA